MTTTFDITDLLWTKADSSTLKTSISGGIYKNQRPANSKKEDVVTNCLPVNNEQLQKTVGNVNVHVPNKLIKVNNVQESVPDLVRLKQLAAEAIGIYKDNWTGTLNYDVQQQTLIKDEEAGDWYINIRIEFNIENL